MPFYDFGFDFDSADISKSAADAMKVYGYLRSFSITPSIAFSGSKGIHMVVPHKVTGMEARADGGHICKLFQEWLKVHLGVETLDVTIHGAKRQWRVPNTINAKSGLFKISLYEGELPGMAQDADGPDYVKRLAQRPRELILPGSDFCPAFSEILKPFVGQADAENAERDKRLAEQKSVTLKALPVCILGILNDPAKVVRQAKTWNMTQPNRNQLTFIAATFFRTHATCSVEETFKILGPEWQRKVEKLSINTPLNQIARSTQTCIQSVHERGFDFSCGNAIKHGCDCSPGCPLYRPMPAKEPDKK